MPPLGGHPWSMDRAPSCPDTLPVPGLHHKETLLGKGGIFKATWEKKEKGIDPKYLKRPPVPSQRCSGKCPHPSQNPSAGAVLVKQSADPTCGAVGAGPVRLTAAEPRVQLQGAVSRAALLAHGQRSLAAQPAPARRAVTFPLHTHAVAGAGGVQAILCKAGENSQSTELTPLVLTGKCSSHSG